MQEKQDSPAKASGVLGKVGQLASGKPTHSVVTLVWHACTVCGACLMHLRTDVCLGARVVIPWNIGPYPDVFPLDVHGGFCVF